MDRIVTSTFTDAELARASDETVINGAPFVVRRDVEADASVYSDLGLNDRGPDLDDWVDETETLGET